MSGRRLAIACGALGIAGLALTSEMAIANDNEFYKGKSVTLVVGFGPGGGNDLYSRTLARHIGRHIPGNPPFIVQNMPGAGSLIAVRHISSNAPTDGTVMANFQSGVITQSLVTPEKVNVDFRNYSWIGNANSDLRVCYAYGAKNVKTWEDLMSQKEFVFGTTAKGTASYVNSATLRSVFDAPVKIVMGYSGSASQRIAIERGELDGACGSLNTIPDDWMRDGKAHIFIHFAQSNSPELPKTSVYAGKLVKTAEQKALLAVLTATDQLSRIFVMSKQVPADRLAIMRRAFDQTMQDKAFLTDAEKQKLPIDPMSGEEVEKIVDEVLSAPPKAIADAKELY